MNWKIRQKLDSLNAWLAPKWETWGEAFEGRQAVDPIDAVYTWVDGADPEFQRELSQHAKTEFSEDAFIAGKRRFRNSDELRYSLRSLEKNANWVNRVFLVTNGQVPKWLRKDHPGLRLVFHRDLFPNREHLPTFNSAAIEMHLHRIPGLSRRYLYLNDDMFFGKRMRLADFLTPAGMPKIRVEPWSLPSCLTEGDLVKRWLSYNRQLLCAAFGERDYASLAHAPILYDRDALQEVEAKWPDEFAYTSAQKFRRADMVLVHVLYTHFLNAQGKCKLIVQPANFNSLVMFQSPMHETVKTLEQVSRKRPPFFCINDDWDSEDEMKSDALGEFLKTYFPRPSSFEC